MDAVDFNRLGRRILTIAICFLMVGCRTNRFESVELACGNDELLPNLCDPTYLNSPDEACIEECGLVDTTYSPLDVSDYRELEFESISLDQCIAWALQNSKVFRDLGGAIIASPQSIDGIFDPALFASNPRFSEEAALSAFDANFSSTAFFQNNDQASNLTFQGNNGIFRQDFHDYQATISKLAATGTIFTLSNSYNYDNSNQTGQTLPHSWLTIFQGEFRHPLLQGSGTLFNRIAGPSTQPGLFGGVLIARTNTEITMSQFQEGVRNLVSEVENAYWDLYFSYRNLEATLDGRDKAYEILVATTEGKSREGSQAQAQAKEQYLRFEADVLNAMEGRPNFGTRNNNGMTGGIFLSSGGVRVTERRLRLICGLPINSSALLKTSDEPASTGIKFDWHQAVDEAFSQRQELVQQRWLIKQKELELTASKNFLKPRLDIIGQYRFRGLGNSLTGNSTTFQQDLNDGTNRSSAFGDLYSGDFQEWQVGAEFSMPFGFRAANLGVRNAELALSRERAILSEQKREVVFGLSNAFGELRRTFASLKAAEEQYVAAKEFQYVMRLEVERGRDRDIELEAQRRVVDAEVAFRRAQIEYTLALKNIHFEKGTYLEYCNVVLTESQSNPQAFVDAETRASKRARQISYVTDSPIVGTAKFNGPINSAIGIDANTITNDLDTTLPETKDENAVEPANESVTNSLLQPIEIQPSTVRANGITTPNDQQKTNTSIESKLDKIPLEKEYNFSDFANYPVSMKDEIETQVSPTRNSNFNTNQQESNENDSATGGIIESFSLVTPIPSVEKQTSTRRIAEIKTESKNVSAAFSNLAPISKNTKTHPNKTVDTNSKENPGSTRRKR